MKPFIQDIKDSIKEGVKVAIIALIITLGVTYAYAAWTGPTVAPPDGNVNAPINVGTVDQIKSGGIGVDTLAVFGNSSVSGYMKIGSTTAECSANTEGSFRYNSVSKNMEFCDSSSWSQVGTSTTIADAGQDPLVNSVHTKDDCVFDGGVVVDDGTGEFMCKFSASSCPSESASGTGWTSYGWTTESASSCSGSGGSEAHDDCGSITCAATSCTTGGHQFQDKTSKYQCGYKDFLRYTTCSCEYSYKTCYSSTSEIGCY